MTRKNTMFGKEKMTAFILTVFFIIATSMMGYGAGKGGKEKVTFDKKDLIIEFNFSDGALNATKNGKPSSFEVNKGQNVIFKIININRLAYQASINGELVINNFNTTAPGSFSLLPTEEKKKEDQSKTEPEVAAMHRPPKEADLVKQLTESIKELKKIKELHLALTEILNKAETFAQLEIQKNKLCIEFLGLALTDRTPITSDVIDKCKNREKKAKELIEKFDTELKVHADLLANIKSLTALEEKNATLKSYRDTLNKGIDTLKKDINKLNEEIKKLNEEIENIKDDITKKDEIKTKTAEIKTKDDMIKTKTAEIKTKTDMIKKNNDEIKKNNDEIKIIKDEIEVKKKALTDFSTTSANPKELIDNLFLLKNLLNECEENKYTIGIKDLLDNVKPENFSVSLTVPTVDVDEVEFTVKIEPTDKKNGQVLHPIKNPVTVLVKGGWLIDFSTGVFFNVNAHDQEYWLEDVAGDETKVILKTKEYNYSVSPIIGAMMHIYPRQTRKIKWSGFAFGLGTGSADKLSYYLGSGVMFGSKNRFLINAGFTAVKMESLLPKFMDKVNKEIDRPAEDVNILKARYKVRLFLSLTYNLGK